MIASFIARHLDSFVRHVWDSSIFLLLILLILLVARNRLTASARFALALIGILKFAIPAVPVVRLLGGDYRPDPEGVFEVPMQVLAGSLHVTYPAAATSSWPNLVAAAWAAVAAVLILTFSITRHRLLALAVRTAMPPLPREVVALTKARARAGVRRSVDIARSALPEAPAVLRSFRPLVVLPASGCEALSDDELESLLCHECAHVARHDNLIARIEAFICALFWFHPLIWIAQRITVIERERACDEVVAGSADERDTYLTALSKFCHAAIAPRLPGVSCMATAKLKERIDHVMSYQSLKERAPSAKRVAIATAAALVAFTIVSGIVGNGTAFAVATGKQLERFAVKIKAVRSGESVAVQGTIIDNETQKVIAAPTVALDSTLRGSMRTDTPGVDVTFDVRPDSDDFLTVDVTIEDQGKTVQRGTLRVATEEAVAQSSPKYTGQPLSLTLKDADLRDVIATFGKLTGTNMQVDEGVQARVTVNWHNVPWDQAFDSLLAENGLTYRVEGSTIRISKK